MKKALFTALAAISILMTGCSDNKDAPIPRAVTDFKAHEEKVTDAERANIAAMPSKMSASRIMADHYRVAIVKDQPKRAELYLAAAKEAAAAKGGVTVEEIDDFALRVKIDKRDFIEAKEALLASKDIQGVRDTMDWAKIGGYADWAYYQKRFKPAAQRLLEEYAQGGK